MNENRWMEARPSIDEQAATWQARRSGSQFSTRDEAELQAWLAASPAHARAFSEMQQIWAELDRVPRPSLSAPVVPLRPRRWRLPLAAAASLLVACALVLVSRGGPEVDETFASPLSATQQVTLADGTRIDLNRATRLRVRLYDDHREVDLLEGEAFFAVARDENRPFDVTAGDGRVRVLGTRFSVRRGEQRLDVVVESGHVAVEPHPGAAQSLELLAGDSLDYDYRTATLEQGHRRPEEIASWRRGQLVFRDRPLAQLLDEVSRYRPAPVGLADPRLAQRRVSGSLNLANPDAFLAALPQLLPVQVEYLADGRALIHPR